MIPPQHIVEIYDDDEFLTDAVVGFIKVGLRLNEPVIIIATAAHSKNFRNALTPDEFASENLTFFDAVALLSDFMVDDWPNQSKFTQVLGNRIQKAGEKGRVRVFGEMEAVLWAEGQYQAAVCLEGLWNTEQTIRPFTLLHAYPRAAFTSTEDLQSLLAVYGAHTHVHHQKTGTPPPRSGYLIAALSSLPSSLWSDVATCCMLLE